MNEWIKIFKALNAEGRLGMLTGIEREGIRVTAQGALAMTPHPARFGDKQQNAHITTDFSESQIELVTDAAPQVSRAYEMLNGLTDIVEDELPADEYYWGYSMPCALKADQSIPLAVYADDSAGREAMAYRRYLMKTYGTHKQLISGIHLNFSFTDNTLSEMRNRVAPFYALRDFKNQVYLKCVRQLLRYRWLIVYLTGCSPVCHDSYFEDTAHLWDYHHPNSVSLRNSRYGYKNLAPLYPSYASIGSYIADIEGFINAGKLRAPKELYAAVRLKPQDPQNVLNSLKTSGIRYIELRMIDLNVFEHCGIAEGDILFVQRMMLYLLTLPESTYSDWQREAVTNAEKVAEAGLDPALQLHRDGQTIGMRAWALSFIEEMRAFNRDCGFDDDELFEEMRDRVKESEKTYAGRIRKEIDEKGYTAALTAIARKNKQQSRERRVIFRGFSHLSSEAQKVTKEKWTCGEY